MATLQELIKEKVLVIDGAMGTQIQALSLTPEQWEGKEGCNELLNMTAREEISKIHRGYLLAGADIIKTNTFGALPWVLEDYGIGERTYELAKEGTRIVKEACMSFATEEKPRFCAAAFGPGTKLPSLGHIAYDEMYEGYKIAARGVIDGGCDLFLIETAQDPLQIKAALHAISDVQKELNVKLPIMVVASVPISIVPLSSIVTETIIGSLTFTSF